MGREMTTGAAILFKFANKSGAHTEMGHNLVKYISSLSGSQTTAD